MDLDASFEATVRAAFAEELAETLREDTRLEQAIREASRDALVASGYDADAVLATLVGPVVDSNPPTDADVRVSWGFTADGGTFLEFGTSPHTIEGDPVLSFVWASEDAPDWVREVFEPEGDGFRVFFAEVTVDGVDETRFTRRSLRAARQEVRRR
jgi:hypothetical protein